MPSLTRTSATLVALMAILVSMLIAAPAAAAQPPLLSASCETLSIELRGYPSSEAEPEPNSVTVSIDGTVVATETFGASYSAQFALGDPATAHQWSVSIDALGASFTPTFTGASAPCAPVLQWNATAAAAVSMASCTSGAQVVLGDISNATWGPVDSDGAWYTVTALADGGHVFDDGLPERTFSGTLAPALLPSSPECETPAVLPTDVAVQPQATPEVAGVAVLAHNGTDSMPSLIAALALVGAGLALRRRRPDALTAASRAK